MSHQITCRMHHRCIQSSGSTYSGKKNLSMASLGGKKKFNRFVYKASFGNELWQIHTKQD